MLTAEHEEAEVLRYTRLKTYAPQRAHGFSMRWLFALLGWHDVRVTPKADISLRFWNFR